MAEATLEERVAALERAFAELVKADSAPAPSPEPGPQRAWPPVPPWPPLTDEQLKAHEEMSEYGRYYRKTGKEPPDDWKPGDPIPEVEVWGDDPGP